MPTPTNLPERLSASVLGAWTSNGISGELSAEICHRYNAHPSLLHEVEELRKHCKEALYMLRTGATKEQLDYRLKLAIDAAMTNK